MISLFILKCFLFLKGCIYLKGKSTYTWEKEGSLPRLQQQPCLGKAKAGSRNLVMVSCLGGRIPGALVILQFLLMSISQNQKETGAAGAQTVILLWDSGIASKGFTCCANNVSVWCFVFLLGKNNHPDNDKDNIWENRKISILVWNSQYVIHPNQ